MKPFESIYWAYTETCNQECPHCYNRSGPGGKRISMSEIEKVVNHLPEKVNRIVLGGGEPLVDMDLTYAVIRSIKNRYGDRTFIAVQTNGDLLTGDIAESLISEGVSHISVSSMDEYHTHEDERDKGVKPLVLKRNRLTALFEKHGMRLLPINFDHAFGVASRLPMMLHRRVNEWLEVLGFDHYNGPKLSYAFWGATTDMWLAGNWPRGRALDNGLWHKDPDHNFCDMWSGGTNFLKSGSALQEVAIQITQLHPCCPGVARPMGDLREESLAAIIERAALEPAWQAINKGRPQMMGEKYGVPRRIAVERIRELGSACLWCDEFFKKHYKP